MSDLIAFLRARLDEDEAAALAVGYRDITAVDYMWGSKYLQLRSGEEVCNTSELPPDLAVHIARHDPARVLREVEAKREIITEHYVAHALKVCTRCSDYVERGQVFRPEPAPCRTLRLLAEPYADHADYRPEWRP